MSKNKPSVLKLKNFQEQGELKPDFYIRTFREHKKEHPFVMKPHSHDFYLLMLFTKGSGSHTIDFTEYRVEPGAVFFMAPAEMHSWNLSDDTDGYVLFFNSAFYLMETLPKHLYKLPFYSAGKKISYGKLKPAALREVEAIALSISSENKLKGTFQPNILRSYLDVLLYKLADLFETAGTQRTTPASVITELEALIDQYFLLHQPVTFYAEKLRTTPQQLNTLTKKYLNKTVTELLHDRLIAEAKRLLIYTSLTVSEITYELQFNDNSYFNRFFKKSEKTTPEQFRRQFDH